VPELPVGIASIAATLVIAAIIIAAKDVVHSDEQDVLEALPHLILCQKTSIANYRRVR
jgi:hypothetical protein